MTVAYWCVFAAIFFPYLWVMVAKSGPGYDNRAPRLHLAAAVIIAQLAHANQGTVDMLAPAWRASSVCSGFCCGRVLGGRCGG